MSALQKTRVYKKWELKAFLPHVWDSAFFRAEIFELLSLLLPLVCWSQGFGYGFLTCYGIIICTRPNLFKTAPKKSNLLGTLVSCYPQSHSCHIFFLNLYGILFLVKILLMSIFSSICAYYSPGGWRPGSWLVGPCQNGLAYGQTGVRDQNSGPAT